MSSPLFDINALTNTIYLDFRRSGETSLTVTNISGRQIYGRVQAVSAALPPEVLTVLDGERFFDVDEVHQFTVRVLLPDTLAAGQYNFEIETMEVEAPDETLQRGAQISFAVTAQPANGASLGILLIVLALVLIGVIVGGTLLLTQSTAAGTAAGQIAFSTVSGGNDEIFVLNPDSGELTNLTDDPAHDRFPTWDSAGTRLAFSSDRSEDQRLAHLRGQRRGGDDYPARPRRRKHAGDRVASRRHAPRLRQLQPAPLYTLIQVQDNGDTPLHLLLGTVPFSSLSYVNNDFISYIANNTVNIVSVDGQGTPFHARLESGRDAGIGALAAGS